MFSESTSIINNRSPEEWNQLLLRAASWKRREYFRFWNEIQNSEWASADLETKWTLIFEKLGEIRPMTLPPEIRFISSLDADYPQDLFELPQPPLGLFVIGELPPQPYFGMVGSRRPLPFSRRVTRDLAARLVEAGYVTVSGGALGIDADAHEATLEAHGKTVVVLGAGLRRLYPKTHEPLFAKVVRRGGALVSEYPPFTEPRPYYFPERNRIIAALSSKLFLAQAHEKSGSLLTARTALDMGRDIYVLRPVPGDPNFLGSQALIEAGAKSVIDAQDLEI